MVTFTKSSWPLIVGAFAFTFISSQVNVCVHAQFPPNGDVSVFNKMKTAVVFEEATKIREAKKAANLVDRAVHFMKAAEKAEEIAAFIERGSLMMPGGGDGEAGAPILQNANAGEQIIDPRTPTGFGDPFFRQVNVEQKVELDAVMTKHEMTEVRSLTEDGTLQTSVNLGWVAVAARGILAKNKIRRPEFMSLLWVSPNRIIRRQCSSCEGKFKDIYYKRKTEEGLSRKLIIMMLGGADRYGFHESDCPDYESCEVKNKCNVDFALYSSYQDAVDEVNPWQYCQTVGFGDGADMYSSTEKIGFPGYSLPKSDEFIEEVQYNMGKETQQDYAFYVEESNWVPIVGSGLLDIGGEKVGQDYEQYTIDRSAGDILYDSPNMIIRRVCLTCNDLYKNVYYKRISYPDDIDVWDLLLRDFKPGASNIMGRDFKIFSTYEDAVNNRNAWEVCETSEVQIGFPALCHPSYDDDVSVYEDQWSRTQEGDMTTLDSGGGHKDFAYYIEVEQVSDDIGDWMTEDDEMMNFLYPGSTLYHNESITCDVSSFSSGGDIPGNFVRDLKPYALLGIEDYYAGWYDLQGCGRCMDWCGWFTPDETQIDGGMNPHYQSWTVKNNLFACVTGDSELANFQMSGSDSTFVDTPFAPEEIAEKFNSLAIYLKFFPTHAQLCEDRNDLSPERPSYKYLGCYTDVHGDRALPTGLGTATLDECHDACRARGFHYFGRQWTNGCLCGGTSADDFSYKKHGETNPFETDSSTGIEVNVPDVEIRRNDWEKCFTAGSGAAALTVKYYAVNLPCSLPSSGLDNSYTPYMQEQISDIWFDAGGYNFGNSGRSNHVAAEFTGYLNFPTSGYYRFCIASDDGSKLWIDDVYKINNDGCHGESNKCGNWYYEAGFHSIRIEFFESGGGAVMKFRWRPPGASSDVAVPSSAWASPSLEKAAQLCQGQSIMFGCRRQGTDTWDVVGYGRRESAFTETSGENDVTVDQNIQWYYDSERSMGFAPAGSSVQLNAADIDELDDRYRISWNFNEDGWRCGDSIWIEGEFERAIWTKEGGGTIIQEQYQQDSKCYDCEGMGGQGGLSNCVFQILYDDYTPSGECYDTDDMDYSSQFAAAAVPYRYQSPPVVDPYAGYYDIQRCGQCNDYCSWVGPSGDGSRVDPRFKASTGTDYFACKLAGGDPEDTTMTAKGHFGDTFKYEKCTGEGFETPPKRTEKFIGCFHDKTSDRALPTPVGEGNPTLSLHDCADSCRADGFHYFGRQYTGQCWCGGSTQADIKYDKHGEIHISSSDYCGACDKDDIGANKNCVFQILDQFDPEIERKKHECSHISFVDVRRYCYVACRDQDGDYKNLLACKNNKVQGLMYLNLEIAAWMDSPKCDRKNCVSSHHPLGDDVDQSKGTF